jgi:hypothetical protein
LVRFLIASDKDYDAVIRFGLVTTATTSPEPEKQRCDRRPTREAIEDALASLCGEYLQTPPPFFGQENCRARARTSSHAATSPSSCPPFPSG